MALEPPSPAPSSGSGLTSWEGLEVGGSGARRCWWRWAEVEAGSVAFLLLLCPGELGLRLPRAAEQPGPGVVQVPQEGGKVAPLHFIF